MRKKITDDKYQEEYTEDFVSHWDDLIDWDGREEGEAGFIERILKAHGYNSVIDVACGTGFHSVGLAKAGLEVTATDGSANMIKQTETNAQEHGVALKETRTVDWLALKDEFPADSFDALVCLGNAFTHLFDHETRRDALRSMASIVRPGGIVILDHRNYDSILDRGYSTKHQYYYTGKEVDAQPVEMSRTAVKFQYSFPNGNKFHLTMYPLPQNYMSFLMEDAGLVDITRYGDFERPYEHYEVDFIQQVAFKPKR